jgi:hypothetical protein
MLRDKIERKKNQEKDKNPIIKRMSTKFNIKTKKIKCKWMNRKKNNLKKNPNKERPIKKYHN